MIKQLIILSLILLFMPIIVSAELKIEPSSITKTVYANYISIIPISIKNSFNFSIHNIHFESSSEEFTLPDEISRLEPNESIDVEIKIKTTEAYGSKTFNLIIKFNFYSLINSESKIFNVTIVSPYLIPSSIEIETGDYIVWHNSETTSHIVYADGIFSKEVQPNSSSEPIRFDTIQSITYCDILFGGCIYHINVLNKSQELTYDSSLNKNIVLTINSRFNETTIEMILLDYNFTMEYDETENGWLRIKNVGDFELKNIVLTADKWVTFKGIGETPFNISVGQQKTIMFTVDPDIDSIFMTNKTHIIDIFAEGENSEKISEIIYVSIPYESDLESYISLSRDELIKKIEELKEVMKEFISEPNCPSHKQYYDTIQKKCISEGELESRLIQYNYTQEEVATFLIKIKEGKDATETFVKYATPKLNNIETTLLVTIMPYLQDLQKLANKSMELAKQNREDIESRRSWRIFGWIIFIFTIIFAIVGGLIWYNNYRDKQSY